MVKVEATKDGLGNIIITENSFEYLLNCLDNQKFLTTQDMQDYIDFYNRECRKILNQRYVFEAIDDGYFLTKRYLYQNKITPWSGDDVGLVYELFKDTIIEWEKPEVHENLLPLDGTESIMDGTSPIGKTYDGWIICDPEPQPWLIERALRYDGDYLTISENGRTNRPWKSEEIQKIQEIFQGCKVQPNNYYKEELWKEQLEKMDDSFIEKYLRKLKLKKL